MITLLIFLSNSLLSADDYPTYGAWLQCAMGYSICGLQTNIEPDTIATDDTGLSDAIFFCC